ncbi:hypothetical protein [Actinacidiphila acididurans]|uniref:Uncharacterized protein n=1 Tax=Actinacidiphila acididurans TaxID=2784346 RepID=A0ABS2U386_9ACTN|nr:hypothetical protein [Actinacidiphila acididurans]MBM9510063.1 hypothetical protein [Actinacidiphila acididurans]
MTEKPTISPDPGIPDHVLLHLPDISYWDTQVWSADVGLRADVLPALRDAINERLAADSPDPELVRIREALAREYDRRRSRLDNDLVPAHAREQVTGELIGLRGALGIALGHSVAGGTADEAGELYYQQWLAGRTPNATTTTTD